MGCRFPLPTRGVARALLVIVSLGLVACAAPPKPLYGWGDYQSSLYAYFKAQGADPGAQISQLEALVERNAGSGVASPPGLHGHLALLYTKVGDEASALKHLQAERQLFPESATYIDFLLKNASRPAAKP
jgi:hypothetical protein